MKYTSRITQITVLPIGEPIFSERATVVSLDDESGGEYITVKQQMDTTAEMNQTVAFEPEEWEEVKGVIDQMFKDIKDYQDEKPWTTIASCRQQRSSFLIKPTQQKDG